jgi:pimeloyl-ACP methyl ester carboxylesterase
MDSPPYQRPFLEKGDIVFLIHGTFAADTDWIDPDSALATSLRATADVVIVPFRWTGFNSHTARLAAGKELEKSAQDLASSHPGVGLHFIGHSHGGNVALYALRNNAVYNRTKSIVFLGTPFLQIRKRHIENRIRFFSYAAAFGLYFLFAIGGLISVINFGAFGEYETVMFLLLMSMIVLYGMIGAGRVYDGLFRFLTRQLQAAQRKIIKVALATRPDSAGLCCHGRSR